MLVVGNSANGLCFQIMSGSLEKLVPMLDGTNWREWEVNMTAFLQMQELWEVVSENTKPIEPQPTTQVVETRAATETTPAATRQVQLPPTAEAMEAYHTLYTPWKRDNSKALGAITLRVAIFQALHTQRGRR
jgi:hypothetical protein